jgi:hypothetical protein
MGADIRVARALAARLWPGPLAATAAQARLFCRVHDPDFTHMFGCYEVIALANPNIYDSAAVRGEPEFMLVPAR